MVRGDLAEDDYTKLEKGLVAELEKAGSTDIDVQPRLNLADETAVHITGTSQLNGAKYLTNQYIAIREGTEYVVTFSFPVDFQQSQWIDITNPTMASWEWK